MFYVKFYLQTPSLSVALSLSGLGDGGFSWKEIGIKNALNADTRSQTLNVVAILTSVDVYCLGSVAGVHIRQSQKELK